jgi:hypothetical protein
VDRLEFLDVVLGDSPALTPVESFYQRMLAGDPDEALDAAETLLKDRSLTAYYDEVALKACRWPRPTWGAACSTATASPACGTPPSPSSATSRTTRTPRRRRRRRRRPSRPSPRPPPPTSRPSRAERAVPSPAPARRPRQPRRRPDAWRADGAILCIAGRGPLDEPGSAMLVQLLRKRGLGARLVPYADVARNRITEFDAAGTVMACVSYLDISGEPAHLRYLLRRLRGRLPGAPLLVGLWPAEAPVLKDRALQGTLGADHYVASLHDAVAACVAEAEKVAGVAGVESGAEPARAA